MIKLYLSDYYREFRSEREALDYLEKLTRDRTPRSNRPIYVKWLEYKEGFLEKMDYMTYHKGSLSETYNTKN